MNKREYLDMLKEMNKSLCVDNINDETRYEQNSTQTTTILHLHSYMICVVLFINLHGGSTSICISMNHFPKRGLHVEIFSTRVSNCFDDSKIYYIDIDLRHQHKNKY